MTNEPPPRVEIVYTDDFKNDLRRLVKKFRHIRDDVNDFIRQLERGETPGNQVQGAGYTVYKARIRSRDLLRGKSGGYRVLYYIHTAERVVLLTVYITSEREDIRTAEIRRIIQALENG